MRYGLIGNPLAHSYSPWLHKKLGGYAYQLFPLEEAQLAPFINSFGAGGLNVTIPYKQAVLPLCSKLSPLAASIGSVNTLLLAADGSCEGHNTDYAGFIFALQQADISVAGRHAVILGSGGVSRTVNRALQDLQAAKISQVSRSGQFNYGNLHLLQDAEIIINCTPIGMSPHVSAQPLDLRLFPHCLAVADLVYNPLRTQLIQQAQALGIKNCGGLAMLAAQAAAAAELFCGRKITQEQTLAALDELRADMENIVLIGMPGCGKSSIAADIAAESGRTLLDSDLLLSQKHGSSPAEIIQSRGEAHFRQLESALISQIALQSGAVISCGGGTVLSAENARLLQQQGKLFFIQRELDELATEQRPLSKDLPLLYQERLPLYRQAADAEISNSSTPLAAAKKILEVHYADMDY